MTLFRVGRPLVCGTSGFTAVNGSAPSIRMLISIPALRSRAGTDRIRVSSSRPKPTAQTGPKASKDSVSHRPAIAISPPLDGEAQEGMWGSSVSPVSPSRREGSLADGG
jgi:hypothetical protein